MRHVRTIAFLIAALLVLGAVRAEGEALFASPPHFLSLRDREQIVFFINEPVVGALASRTSPDTIEIVVPRAIVDPTLRAMTFRADENDAVAGTRVALAPAPRGNAAIKIITGEPPGGVHAYSESDPPRLIVDLLAAAPQPTVTPIRKPAAAATRAHAAPTAKPSPVATAAPGATLKPTAAKPTAVAATAALPSARPPSPRPTPLAERGPTVPRPQATAPESLGALRSTVAVATRTDTAASDAFPCAWRRVAGVPFCAPDPGAPPYATRRELAALASALAGDTAPASLPDAPDDDEPAALYLAADRELVARARSGRLLPAIDLYRRALRRAPRFFDAPRARLNVALTYRTLGFDAELQSVAREAAGDPTRPLLDALVGDVARERGAVDRARDAYARADTNGVAACLATRGRAALALDTDPPASAADDVARLPDLCPPALLADPETMLVQARQQLAAGDAHRSLTMLEAIRQAPGAGQEGAVVDGIAAAADAAGDTTRARAAYADLASGRFGGRFATRGTIGLARLDAAAGDVQGGFRRLGALAPDTAAPQRQRFAQDALSRALAHADHADAVAIVADQGIAPAALSTDDQILLARSYRVVGLARAAEALLRRLADTLGKSAPDALWEERGEAALASDAAPQALAVADDWLRARGNAAPGAALALRARALASLGQSALAARAAGDAAAALDPVAARALRLDVAGRLRTADPAAAARLAHEALVDEHAPPLSRPEAAAALRTLAEAAEASGDDGAALAAYRELTSRYADQPGAAGVSYRMARLAAGGGRGAAAAAYADVARSRDTLERRVGSAAEAYETIVRPFENRREEP